MKKCFLARILYSVTDVTILDFDYRVIDGFENVDAKLDLPEGCVGLMLVFDSKESAYNHCGDNVEISEVIIGGCEDESS
jgi:hypothetical protein